MQKIESSVAASLSEISSDRHHEPFSFREFSLIPVKGEKMRRLHETGAGHMENIKSSVAACQGAD